MLLEKIPEGMEDEFKKIEKNARKKVEKEKSRRNDEIMQLQEVEVSTGQRVA